MQIVLVNSETLSTAFVNGCFSFVVKMNTCCPWVSSLEDGTLLLPTTSTPLMCVKTSNLSGEYLSSIFRTYIPGKTFFTRFNWCPKF